MNRLLWPVVTVVLSLAVAASLGVTSATAANGGNSANAKLCQKGGWMNVQGSDATQFGNQGECVSFGAHGGTIVPKPTCTAGSDNFSDDAEFSQPTTFAGGTIDTSYGVDGGVYFDLTSFPGQNAVFSGGGVNSFKLTFANAVSSVQVDASSNSFGVTTHLTLTAFDASNAVVGSSSATQPATVAARYTLSVGSSSDNIKYFTVATDDPTNLGVIFGNIVWDCA